MTVIVTHEHCHDPDKNGCVVRKVISEAKDCCITTRHNPSEVIARATASMSMAERAQLPTNEAFVRRLQNARHKQDARPRAPTSVSEVQINGADCVTESGQHMLLHDNHDDNQRLIMFGTVDGLMLLHASKSWVMDGTFEDCPHHFAQLVVIHAEFEVAEGEADAHTSWVFPCVWALLSGKSQVVYEELFSQLAVLAPGDFDTFPPDDIMCDFEMSMRNAIQIHFPNTMIGGCYFHYNNALRKHVFKKHKSEYMTMVGVAGEKEYSPIHILAKRLMGLALVPVGNVMAAYEEILRDLPVEGYTKYSDFLEYFQNTWVNGRYTLQSWNVHGRTLAKQNRTNNHCESFHSRLSYFIKGSGKPTIWGFIHGMKLYQSDVNNSIASRRAGKKPKRRTPKQVNKNNRILAAINQLDQLPILEYLDLVMNL